MGQGAAAPGEPKVSRLIAARPHRLDPQLLTALLTTRSIVIALAGNKLDLVQPGSADDADTSATTATSDDGSEADDATATPEGGEGGEAATAATGESRRQVSREEAEEYAKESGLLFFETSAKTGEGVVEVFTEIGTSSSGRRVSSSVSASVAADDRVLCPTRSQEDPPGAAHLVWTRPCRSPWPARTSRCARWRR